MKNRWKTLFCILAITSSIIIIQPTSSHGQNNATSIPVSRIMEEGAYTLGTLAYISYIYGGPVVQMYWMRFEFTSVFGLNCFYHRRNLEDYTSIMKGVNNDTLYSIAWLDLSHEPVLLHVPDTQGRYYVFQFVDFFTNTFSYVGKRVTGTRAGDYAIVGPKWEGSLPKNVNRINAPTNSVYLLGRTLVSGKNDLPNANALQDQYQLTPLSRWGIKESARSELRKPDRPPVDHWGHPLKFFQILNLGLGENPPPKRDDVLMSLFEIIHVGPGKSFDIDAIHPAISKGLERAIHFGQQINKARPSVAELADYGLKIDQIGNYGSNYLLRAALAMSPGQIGTLTPEECTYFGVRVDHKGEALNGKYRYRLRFEKEDIPPVNAFWSVTLYDQPKFQLVENPIHRYSIGDRTEGLQYGQDGSLEIIIQHALPDVTEQANWLPAPNGDFSLTLRAYMPTSKILSGQWTVPPVSRIE